MRSAIAITSALAALASGYAAPTFAHHSQAMFDMNQCLSLQGTVRNWEFGFPHSWLWMIVINKSGAQEIWGLESASPAQMVEVNPKWTRDVVKKGDKISITYSPLKDGRTGGALNKLTLPDGNVLRAATPACAGQPPPK